MTPRRFVVLSCLALGLLPVAGLAEQLVIVASTAEGLPRGTMIDGTAELTLPAGSSLTLVAKSGELIQLAGPFQGKPSPGDPEEGDAGLLFALEQLLENRKAEETPGVFRAGESGDQPAGPWWIDASRSGHYCVHPGHPPVLWRPRPAGAESLEVRQLRGGGAGEARWAEGEATAAWPAGLALEDGASYVLQRGRSPRRQIILHVLGEAAGEDELRQLVGLVSAGCMQQAETLAATLE